MNQPSELLKESFEALIPVRDEVFDYFAARILTDRQALVIHLRDSFDFLCGSWSSSHNRRNYFRNVGQFHSEWVIETNHQELISIWLETLSYFFGNTWSDELSDSWHMLMKEISNDLILGAEGAFKGNQQPKIHVLETGNEQQFKETEIVMKEEVQNTLRELIRETLNELIREEEVKSWIRDDSKALLKEMMLQEIQQLREKWKTKQAA